MLKSLEIVNDLLEEKENECYKAYGIFLEKQIKELRTIKQDLEVLEIFIRYISLSYIKNLISENEFSLNNFDWDIKDEKRLTNRIEELLKLKQYLESDKVGDNS